MPMIQTQNVPKLRLPGFEGEWETMSLYQLSNSGFNNGVFNDPQNVGSGYKLINVKDMFTSAGIKTEGLSFLNITEKEFKKNKVEHGDIFFTRSSLVKEGIAFSNVFLSQDEDVTYDGHLIKMSPDTSKLFPLFGFYSLRTTYARRQLVARGKTTTMTTIGQDDISKTNLSTPTLPEQRKIASFLGAVDKKIAHLSRKKALLEDYKKGCMQQLFSQKIRFKDDDGKDFPDWEEKRLGEVAERVRQKNTDLALTDVLTNSAIQGIISQSDYFDHDVANAENLDRYTVVQIGDFVYNPRISTTAPVGPIKRNMLRSGVMSPLYDVFRFSSEENLGFWEQYFRATAWNKYMKQVANYGARHDRMAISSSDFFCMPLPYPNPPEQRKIADFLSALDRKIDLVAQELTHARSFKAGLLQQMFV